MSDPANQAVYVNLPIRRNRRNIVALFIVLATLLAAWHFGLFTHPVRRPPQNAVMVISPYRYQGTWVFDDPAAGLVREPFVAGIPEMIDYLVANVPNADHGFRLFFSAHPFPGHQRRLTWTRSDGTGNYYRLDDPPLEGWLCPSLFKYFEKAPPELYVKAEALN